MATASQRVKTCLWFDTEAEDAATFYVSLLPGSRITGVSRYGTNAMMPAGTVLMVTFDLAGSGFMALNGGPRFKFTEATSMVVECDDQAEIDRLWSALLADGGQELACGWLKDRYGLSWQIIPAKIGAWLTDPDRERTDRVFQAVMGMVKIDIAACEAAFRGG